MTADRFGRRDLAPEFSHPTGVTEPYVYAASWTSPARVTTALNYWEAQMSEFGNVHTDSQLAEHLAKVAVASGLLPLDHPENFGVNDNDLFANQAIQPPTVLLPGETPVEAHRRLQAA